MGDWIPKRGISWKTRLFALSMMAACTSMHSQQPDSSAIVRMVDAAVLARANDVTGFTDTEHYLVFRGQDETHPIAEMTVLDTYKKGIGKNYTILSQSGSALVQRFGLHTLLENEKTIN